MRPTPDYWLMCVTVVTPESSLGGGFTKNNGSAWQEVLPRPHLQGYSQFSLSLKGCLKMRYMPYPCPPYHWELHSTLMNFPNQMLQHRQFLDRILDIIHKGVHEVRGVLEEWPQPKTWWVSPLKHWNSMRPTQDSRFQLEKCMSF